MSSDILVTGGAGFLGSDFVRHTVASTGHRIVVLDSLTTVHSTTALESTPRDRVELVIGDVRDRPLVRDLVARVDAVVHFAAQTHNDTSLADPGSFVETNVLGTYTVLEAARAHGRRFHYVSTDEVFGDVPLDSVQLLKENAPLRPSSPYSASKAAGDLMVLAWARSFGVPVTITNSCNGYGAFQHVEKFIPRQITNVLTGRKIKLYGSGEHVRDWLHADDHSSAVLAVLERGRVGHRYMVSAGDRYSNRQVAGRILTLLGRPADELEHVRDRAGHDLKYAVDAGKLRTELGWKPRRRLFEDGLREVADWYRQNESWWSEQKAAVEAAYAARGQ